MIKFYGTYATINALEKELSEIEKCIGFSYCRIQA